MKLFSSRDREDEKLKIQEQKSLGHLQKVYRSRLFKPIGFQNDDFLEENGKENQEMLFEFQNDLESMRIQLWGKMNSKIRADIWRAYLHYIPLNRNQRNKVLEIKRKQYIEYTQIYNYEKALKQKEDLDVLNVILNDVKRTLSESHLFKLPVINESMIRILYIYFKRHPHGGGYIQGLNDILAPFLAVIICERFQQSYQKLQNNMHQIIQELEKEDIKAYEGDAFFLLELFLATAKDNFSNGFDGVHTKVSLLKNLLKITDSSLYDFFNINNIELGYFIFRWIFCFLIREFPLHLKDCSPSEFNMYVSLGLLLKFSFQIQKMEKGEAFNFLQNLPTESWGFKDIDLLVSEAYVLRERFRYIVKQQLIVLIQNLNLIK